MAANPLADALRCCLAVALPAAPPLLAAQAFWSDDRELWMALPVGVPEVAALRSTSAASAWVADPDGGPGVVVSGEARLFGAADPAGLVWHGPALLAAVSALVLKTPSGLLGLAQDVASVSPRWLLAERAILRLRIDARVDVTPPVPTPGIAPALPPTLPSPVRRALAGRRDVVLGVGGADGVRISPAAWGAGFALTAGDGDDLPARVPATAFVEATARRQSGLVGVALHGELDGGRLRPSHATVWQGYERSTVEVPAPPAGAVVLPD